MTLFMNLNADQFHSKPMAISSITSPVGTKKAIAAVEDDANFAACSSPSSSTNSNETSSTPNSNEATSDASPSPPSRSVSSCSASSNSSFLNSPNNNTAPLSMKMSRSENGPSLPRPTVGPTSFYHPYHHYASIHVDSVDNDGHNLIHENGHVIRNMASVAAPLSLHERRLRNKTASAKYRAKKNQQHGEMRAMISSLTKENELLLRQLDHTQHENNHLKATCDRLRGKLIAQKMLKQYLVETEHPGQNAASTIDQQQLQNGSSCFLHYHPSAIMEHHGSRKFSEEKGDCDKRN